MNVFRTAWSTMGVVCLVVFAAAGNVAFGAVVKIVSPPTASGAEGNSSILPNRDPIRVQFLIPASEFAGLPATHRRIVGFNFRSDRTQTTPVNWTFPNEQIWMSTTSLNSLTTTFDANQGADKKLVFNGAVTYPLLGSGPAAGPRDIADGLKLQSPFFYDPSKGNLLIEEKRFDGNYPVPATIDVALGISGRLLLNDPGPNAPTGNLLDSFPVLQIEFDVVPEPSTIALAGIVLLCPFARRRKGKGVSGNVTI
jgi:hypothetical protein